MTNQSKVAEERAAIVAWLRGVPDARPLTDRERNSRAFSELVSMVNQLANAIERGDHLRGDGK